MSNESPPRVIDSPIGRKRGWTAVRAALRGGLLGGGAGVVFLTAYAIAGSMFCVGLNCPSWQSYAISSAVGLVGFVAVGAMISWALYSSYQMFKVE